MTSAENFRAAEERIRMGDSRIDIGLRGPLRDWLDAMADWAASYPEMHDRSACDDYACDAMGRALALAHAILGESALPADGPAEVEHCVHDRAIHYRHHRQSVVGCPWCTRHDRGEVSPKGLL